MGKLPAAIVAIILMLTSFLNLMLRAQEITASWTVSDIVHLSLTPSLIFMVGVVLFVHTLVETVFPSNSIVTYREDSEDSRIL